MTTVEQAKEIIRLYQAVAKTETKLLQESLGQVLAEAILSPIDMPPFPQSAMDGYALGPGSKTKDSIFKVIGEVAAGSAEEFQLGKDECVRIFTGAPVPSSATAVVQQEWADRTADEMTLTNDVVDRKNIRPRGEQLQKGNIALEMGTELNAAAIGFLQMLGVMDVTVYTTPRVSVLVTGNELVDPGTDLKRGQIYESNSLMLISALQTEGVLAYKDRVKDDLEQTISKIADAIENNDVVIITGGISVGDHDHVGSAFQQLGVKELFYKVAQKPGKPIFFGTKDGKAIFGLPGNPAASLVCYYEYVLPVLRKFMGKDDLFLPLLNLPLASGTVKKMPRSQFLKARVEHGQVHVLEGQSSAMLNTFALSNALAYVPANSEEIPVGHQIEVHLLP